jgi:hydrogenase maturation factor HypF (carbamoyltransferase family)
MADEKDRFQNLIPMTSGLSGFRISITGIVQGVGFRPYVFSLAQKYQLSGNICNTSTGVEIRIYGGLTSIEKFLVELRDHPPILSQIHTFVIHPSNEIFEGPFKISPSQVTVNEFVPISPDVTYALIVSGKCSTHLIAVIDTLLLIARIVARDLR